MVMGGAAAVDPYGGKSEKEQLIERLEGKGEKADNAVSEEHERLIAQGGDQLLEEHGGDQAASPDEQGLLKGGQGGAEVAVCE